MDEENDKDYDNNYDNDNYINNDNTTCSHVNTGKQSSKAPPEKTNWHHDHTRKFLSTLLCFKDKIHKTEGKKEAFERAQLVLEEHGVSYVMKELERKYWNMLRSFRKIQYKMEMDPNFQTQWPYYNEMLRITEKTTEEREKRYMIDFPSINNEFSDKDKNYTLPCDVILDIDDCDYKQTLNTSNSNCRKRPKSLHLQNSTTKSTLDKMTWTHEDTLLLLNVLQRFSGRMHDPKIRKIAIAKAKAVFRKAGIRYSTENILRKYWNMVRSLRKIEQKKGMDQDYSSQWPYQQQMLHITELIPESKLEPLDISEDSQDSHGEEDKGCKKVEENVPDRVTDRLSSKSVCSMTSRETDVYGKTNWSHEDTLMFLSVLEKYRGRMHSSAVRKRAMQRAKAMFDKKATSYGVNDLLRKYWNMVRSLRKIKKKMELEIDFKSHWPYYYQMKRITEKANYTLDQEVDSNIEDQSDCDELQGQEETENCKQTVQMSNKTGNCNRKQSIQSQSMTNCKSTIPLLSRIENFNHEQSMATEKRKTNVQLYTNTDNCNQNNEPVQLNTIENCNQLFKRIENTTAEQFNPNSRNLSIHSKRNDNDITLQSSCTVNQRNCNRIINHNQTVQTSYNTVNHTVKSTNDTVNQPLQPSHTNTVQIELNDSLTVHQTCNNETVERERYSNSYTVNSFEMEGQPTAQNRLSLETKNTRDKAIWPCNSTRVISSSKDTRNSSLGTHNPTRLSSTYKDTTDKTLWPHENTQIFIDVLKEFKGKLDKTYVRKSAIKAAENEFRRRGITYTKRDLFRKYWNMIRSLRKIERKKEKDYYYDPRWPYYYEMLEIQQKLNTTCSQDQTDDAEQNDRIQFENNTPGGFNTDLELDLDDLSEEKEEPQNYNLNKTTWSHPNTLLLLNSLEEFKGDMHHLELKRQALKRATKALNDSGHDYAYHDVERKYNNMHRSYKKIVLKTEANPHFKSNWPYFEQMKQITQIHMNDTEVVTFLQSINGQDITTDTQLDSQEREEKGKKRGLNGELIDKTIWPKEQTEFLLNILEQFKDSIHKLPKRREAFEKAVESFGSRGDEYSYVDVERKYYNMLRSFRKIRYKKEMQEDYDHQWPYYYQMERITAKTIEKEEQKYYQEFNSPEDCVETSVRIEAKGKSSRNCTTPKMNRTKFYNSMKTKFNKPVKSVHSS